MLTRLEWRRFSNEQAEWELKADSGGDEQQDVRMEVATQYDEL